MCGAIFGFRLSEESPFGRFSRFIELVASFPLLFSVGDGWCVLDGTTEYGLWGLL